MQILKMESYSPDSRGEKMKKASLEKDETKIPTLGPYAAALSFILGNASKSRF